MMSKILVRSMMISMLFSFSSSNTILFAAPTPPVGVAPTTNAPEPVAKVSSSAAGNVSLDFKDADINNVLRILSLKSRVNIVAGPEVQGTVTIRLEDVPWDKALDVVLRTYGYVYEREGNIIRVTTKENLATEELVTETFILNYTTSAEAQEAIEDILSERGRIRSVARTNMLVVTDIPTNVFKIREVIRKLDRATPQAFIDAKVVQTTLQQGNNLGLQWGTNVTLDGAKRPISFPFAGVNQDGDSRPIDRVLNRFFPIVADGAAQNPFSGVAFPVVADNVESTSTQFELGTLDFTSFSTVLQFLRTRANTKVISNPRITVLNNQTARINVGAEIPLPSLERNESTGSFEITGFEYRETGVTFEVTPHINDADEILVDLHPEVSSVGSTNTSFGGTEAFSQIPNFDVESAETQVLIRSGETIAIGGLMTDSANTAETKVPILGDIPLFGKLFKSKRQTQGASNQKEETLFFVTVTVVDTEGQPVIQTPSYASSLMSGVNPSVMGIQESEARIA
jgi:type IV pilus secretin PilQ/predicted competence protein